MVRAEFGLILDLEHSFYYVTTAYRRVDIELIPTVAALIR